MPPQVVARKAVRKASGALGTSLDRRRDRARSTYLAMADDPGQLRPLLAMPRLELLRPHAQALAGLTRHYLDHRFDILGSGWVVVRHGMTCRGLEGHRFAARDHVTPDRGGRWIRSRVSDPNADESSRIWGLVDPVYNPIDWQLDLKSGWRWSERTWYRDIAYGDVPGVDVKVPWELARMQHLPQLALAGALSSEGLPGFEPADRYAREFRNEVLDFIAANPPRYGVNWVTSMDVAIRVANWLVAYDLFRAGGTTFDEGFDRVFRRSVVEHGVHLEGNLEWDEGLRGNHYLADMIGLLFVSAALPRNPRTDAWLALAIQELVVEASLQFTPDGGNFEASTCYHRLSAEMIAYGVGLVLGLGPDKRAALQEYDHRRVRSRPGLRPAPVAMYPDGHGGESPLPVWLLERVERMAEFVVDLTKPDDHVPQVGDNDSGRFLKVLPAVTSRTVADVRSERGSLEGYQGLPDDATYWDEDHLDHRHVVAAVNGLFGRPDLGSFARAWTFESELVAAVAGGRRSSGEDRRRSASLDVRIGAPETHGEVVAWLASLDDAHRRQLEIKLPDGVVGDNVSLAAYPDFGLFVARSASLYLVIRCGPIGQNGRGGHAHNDQLSIELNVDGADWVRDPGSYLYTPLPARRNQYRSVGAHFVPRLEGPEPARLDLGPFVLGGETEATCLYWGPLGFAGRVRMSGGRILTGLVGWGQDAIVLSYGVENGSFAEVGRSPDDWRTYLTALPFSPGYGIVERAMPA